jgi:uncharacterized coiled-coil protein SlyX
MTVKTSKSRHQSSNNHIHTPKLIKGTDTQTLSELLLEELHKALSWQQQTLAEAAVEIQGLLKQLEETNPTASEAEQKAFVTAAISRTRRELFLSALQAGWKEAIKEFLDHSYLNIGIATLEEWKVTD